MYCKKIVSQQLEAILGAREIAQLLLRTLAVPAEDLGSLFLAPAWWFTTSWNFSSRGFHILSGLTEHQAHMWSPYKQEKYPDHKHDSGRNTLTIPGLLTLVTTARMAIPCMMGCHAPMSRAFSGTMRLYWVVSFHASTLISNILFTRASRGASGKEATNKVTNPNWITVNGTDTHHGGEDRRQDNIFPFTLVRNDKGKQRTHPSEGAHSRSITTQRSQRDGLNKMQTGNPGKETNYSSFPLYTSTQRKRHVESSLTQPPLPPGNTVEAS